MKHFPRFLGFLLFCIIVSCASCVWAGTLTATYTYDGTSVEMESSKFQIEEKREVQFLYRPSSYEVGGDYSIEFTDGGYGPMTLSDGNYVYSHTFSSTGEVGISINASGFKPISADVTDAMPFELDPPRMTMKPNESNRFVKFIGDANILSYSVEPTTSSLVMAQAAYESVINPPHVTVSAGSSEGEVTLYVTFTHRTTGVSFRRTCAITIDESSTESNMSNGGGGGGCNSGFAGLGLLLLAGVNLVRTHKSL